MVYITAASRFRVEVIKTAIPQPTVEWRNTYEVLWEGSGQPSEADLVNLGADLMQFEAAIHLDYVQFGRYIISTWDEETPPDPTSFISIDLGGLGPVGARSQAASQSLPLHQCLLVRRQILVGHSGHLFYRGCLTEAMVQATDLQTFELVPSETQVTSLYADFAAAETEFTAQYYAGGTSEFRLALIAPTLAGPTLARPLTNLNIQGVTNVKMKKKWYNVTP